MKFSTVAICIVAAVLLVAWSLMLWSVLKEDDLEQNQNAAAADNNNYNNQINSQQLNYNSNSNSNSNGDVSISSLSSTNGNIRVNNNKKPSTPLERPSIVEPLRYPKDHHHSDDPAPLSEIEKNMTYYLSSLHARLKELAGPKANAEEVWETYLDVTKNTMIKWDDENRGRFPRPRKDKSIFVSLGTYRDPYCPMTIKSLYRESKHPERLFVGMFQQNCFEAKCRTGVLKGGIVEDAPTDIDCYKEFCDSIEGQRSRACLDNRVRLFNVNESESLGPYMARYLGAKFYRGEQFYLQIDSHSEFVKDWDDKLIKMVMDAPARKPVISTYPPDSTHNWRDSIGFRMCDSEFARAQIEWQIIRLGSSMAFDHSIPTVPKYAPFVAAGFFFSYADFLYEVPFDPLLPWIFMGEEMSMSSRLWTAGYDIFSPTVNVLNHYYVRRHYPKFWETTNRFFKHPIHNDLVEIVIKRCKYQLGYPESTTELIHPPSVLYRAEDWGMGDKRSYESYLKMVGIDMKTKVVTPNDWCHNGEWPAIAKNYYFQKN